MAHEFLIADFEGQANREAAGRRIKRSALRGRGRHDPFVSLCRGLRALAIDRNPASPTPRRRPARSSIGICGAAPHFSSPTPPAVAGAGLLPESESQRKTLLRFHLLQRAVTELIYDWNTGRNGRSCRLAA